MQYMLQSRIKSGRYFWLASVLVFFAVIRRELNHLPDLFISNDFLFFNLSYDWWEDIALTIVYILMVGLLIYSWRYCWTVLKNVPITLYFIVAVLATVQYMGENAILFPPTFGVIVEELTEASIYSIALIYLWEFKLKDFEACLSNKLNFETVTQ